MKRCNSLFSATLTAALLWQGLIVRAATVVTVNSTNNQNIVDAEVTLAEAILIQNGTLGRALSLTESLQVAAVAGTTNRINFNIPGAGPHYILRLADAGSFPVITASNLVVDGYTQPGAQPNTNAILAPNSAVLKIVLDCRNSMPIGDAGRALSLAGNNIQLRGLSLLQTISSDIFGPSYGFGFESGAVGGSIQGCWVGLDPDGATVGGGEIGIDVDGSGGGQVIGTDGDGVNDRAEFNVIVANNVNVIVEAGSKNCRVSGNFIGVMPDGLSVIPPAAFAILTEGDAFEGEGADDLIFGTDANGIADADERNIVGGMQADGATGRNEVFEIWGVWSNLKIMGNYFGVGIDGVTPLGNERFLNVVDGTTAQIGANGDGVREEMEANIIANNSEYVFRFGGPAAVLNFPHNSFFGNTGSYFSEPQNSFNGVILGTGDLGAITPVISNSTTRTELVGWVPVSGPGSANLSPAAIAIYVADPGTNASYPQGLTWLASYLDNGPQDLDPATNSFRFNIASLPIPATGASLVVSETAKDDFGGGSSTFSSALPLPDVSGVTLTISGSAAAVTITWPGSGILQATPGLSPTAWTNVPGTSPVTVPIGPGSLFFRLAP